MSAVATVIMRLERLASPEFRRGLMQMLGDEMIRQVNFGFETRSDTAGTYWKARKKDQPWPVLEKTSALRRSWKVTSVDSDHVRISSDVPYAQYPQFGTTKMVPRRMVPAAGSGLGIWGPRLRYLTVEMIKGALHA